MPCVNTDAQRVLPKILVQPLYRRRVLGFDCDIFGNLVGGRILVDLGLWRLGVCSNIADGEHESERANQSDHPLFHVGKLHSVRLAVNQMPSDEDGFAEGQQKEKPGHIGDCRDKNTGPQCRV